MSNYWNKGFFYNKEAKKQLNQRSVISKELAIIVSKSSSGLRKPLKTVIINNQQLILNIYETRPNLGAWGSIHSPVLILCVHPLHPVLKEQPLLVTGAIAL